MQLLDEIVHCLNASLGREHRVLSVLLSSLSILLRCIQRLERQVVLHETDHGSLVLEEVGEKQFVPRHRKRAFTLTYHTQDCNTRWPSVDAASDSSGEGEINVFKKTKLSLKFLAVVRYLHIRFDDDGQDKVENQKKHHRHVHHREPHHLHVCVPEIWELAQHHVEEGLARQREIGELVDEGPEPPGGVGGKVAQADDHHHRRVYYAVVGVGYGPSNHRQAGMAVRGDDGADEQRDDAHHAVDVQAAVLFYVLYQTLHFLERPRCGGLLLHCQQPLDEVVG
mmetsp:Transcript_43156/g.82310  ORF Transcript_43156/g.82310 Transcript_43156/m.82310 type:complete len:281 (+) Transcript_43156:542-1384(+)